MYNYKFLQSANIRYTRGVFKELRLHASLRTLRAKRLHKQWPITGLKATAMANVQNAEKQ
jgi:hypothetical protein